jgi:ATP-dependent DNA helicase RecG
MALPINIENLLTGKTVEWDRIEFKKGWNPEDVMHTICAFANDINNWGGGYIFVGIEEKDGLPILPAVGLQLNQFDGIQKELVKIANLISPYYCPVSQPYQLDGKDVLVIWVPGGDNRPYKSPVNYGKKDSQRKYYVRRNSVTKQTNHQEEQLLLEMAKKIPFDDRVNHQASMDDLSFNLMRGFLEEVKSDLRKESLKMPLSDLALQMRVANGPPEAIFPLNVGLLFFNETPHKFFRGAVTEFIVYSDNSGKNFTEKKFMGPIHLQMREVLEFFKTNIFKENVSKSSHEAQAKRVVNFPFDAVEEAVANAFYHRSYENESPIEINIWTDKLEILSFPGPLPPVTKEMLKERRVVARTYRNRRVGDFFKELKLTEGRASGFPTIYDSMEQNGSPNPIFKTDDDFNYFLCVLPIHPIFLTKEITAKDKSILSFCLNPQKRFEVLNFIGLKNLHSNYVRHILPLIERGFLEFTYPENPTSPNQEYVTTETGKDLL